MKYYDTEYLKCRGIDIRKCVLVGKHKSEFIYIYPCTLYALIKYIYLMST